jgi:hypothetical protein
MTLTSVITKTPLLVVQSIIGATALCYLQQAAQEAFVWLIPSVAVIIADFKFGIDAARFRGEIVRFSTAIRRTGNKILAYACWIFVAVGINFAYHIPWIPAILMALVIGNELVSCANNYLEPHKKRISFKGLFRFIGKKTNNQGIEEIIEDIPEDETKS